MRLTDLADVARRAGLTVAEQPGWRSRGHGDMRPPRSITLHHTAGPQVGDAPSLGTVRDGRPDLKGPLAHLLVARSGTVHVVAAGLCWHTGKTHEPWQANTYAIGIEAEHTGRPGDPWPEVQLAALRTLARALADHYTIPYVRVVGHREIADPAGRKPDPVGIDLPGFRAALTLPAPRQEAPVPAPTSPVPTVPTLAPPLAEADIERIARRVADLVWQRPTRNAWGDVVPVELIVGTTEARVAALQAEVAALRDRLGE